MLSGSNIVLGQEKREIGVGENFESASESLSRPGKLELDPGPECISLRVPEGMWIVGRENGVQEDKIRDASCSCVLSAEPLGCAMLWARGFY